MQDWITSVQFHPDRTSEALPSKVEKLIEQATKDGDYILDSFSGSGTTAHSVLNLSSRINGSRKFILVEIDDNISRNVTSKRIEKVIDGYEVKVAKGNIKKIEGTGGGFRYCTLGEPLFDADGDVNSAVSFPDLAAHVFFCETGSPIPKRADAASRLIGTFQDRAIYLLQNPTSVGVASEKAGNVLTLKTLEAILSEDDFTGPRVVYAEGCTVPDARLDKAGVTFKQIPYQIEGL